MTTIAISYRRTDSSAIAGRIFDHLTAHYGEKSVFMDVEAVPFGIDFRNYIREVLLKADVLITVIGANWLGTDAVGRVRMADNTDPVHVEIETALERRIPIIPVLVEGARMPDTAALPPKFANFAFLNAAEVTSGREFRTQMDRLIRAIDHAVSVDAAGAGAPKRWLVDIQRYLLFPLLLMLVGHYIIDFNNFSNWYLWLDATLVPLAFGYALRWFDGDRTAPAIVSFAVALGLLGATGMTISNSLVSGDPIMPQTGVEWRNNINFAGAIALSYLAGYVLAVALRTARKLGKL
jgi:hypothetical protein